METVDAKAIELKYKVITSWTECPHTCQWQPPLKCTNWLQPGPHSQKIPNLAGGHAPFAKSSAYPHALPPPSLHQVRERRGYGGSRSMSKSQRLGQDAPVEPQSCCPRPQALSLELLAIDHAGSHTLLWPPDPTPVWEAMVQRVGQINKVICCTHTWLYRGRCLRNRKAAPSLVLWCRCVMCISYTA